MRNSGSYQLVSEHPILSAQRKNKVAAMEEFLEKQALHSKPEWNEELDKIKRYLQRRTKDDGGRRSRRDHATCNELSENDFEIYLEMKLEWLQQFYVAANSTKSEKRNNEPEEEGWNENSEEELNFQKLDVMVNHQNQKKEEPVSIITKSEEVETGREGDVSETPEGAIAVVMIKERRREISGDLEPPQEQVKIGAQGEEDSLTKEPPPEPPDCGMFKATVGGIYDRYAAVMYGSVREGDNALDGGVTRAEVSSSKSGEMVLSRETTLSDGEEVEQRSRGNDQTTTTAPGGGSVAEVPPLRDADEQSLNLVSNGCDRFGLEKNARVKWNVGEVDPVISLGQAQASIGKSALIIKSAKVFVSQPSQFNIGERVEKLVGADWTLREVDLNSSIMGQAQTSIITSTQFTSIEGGVQKKVGWRIERSSTSICATAHC